MKYVYKNGLMNGTAQATCPSSPISPPPGQLRPCGGHIINGEGGSVLDPTGKITRAEAAAMLMRYCGAQ